MTEVHHSKDTMSNTTKETFKYQSPSPHLRIFKICLLRHN